MFDKCIIDLGANDGSDTLMYLNQGYYVYSIDANPFIIESITKLIPECYKNYCEILNIGISEKIEEVDFYINYFSPWSSFNKNKGSQKAFWIKGPDVGLKKIIKIKTLDLKTLYQEHILKKFNSIEYLKIDVEGKDIFVLKSLEKTDIRPNYISCELGSIEMLMTMRSLGYKTFNIIDQSSIRNNKVKLTTIDNKIIDYTLSSQTSGKFGTDLLNWVTFDVAEKEIFNLDRSANRWYDIHASKH